MSVDKIEFKNGSSMEVGEDGEKLVGLTPPPKFISSVDKILQEFDAESIVGSFVYQLSQAPITEDWYNFADENVKAVMIDILYSCLPLSSRLKQALQQTRSDVISQVEGYSNKELGFVLEQLKTETDDGVIEYLIGKRNALRGIIQSIKQNNE